MQCFDLPGFVQAPAHLQKKRNGLLPAMIQDVEIGSQQIFGGDGHAT
jgi:hypothetical protein